MPGKWRSETDGLQVGATTPAPTVDMTEEREEHISLITSLEKIVKNVSQVERAVRRDMYGASK